MSTKHISYLDSLRGLACMIVVILHTIIVMYPGLHEGTYTGVSINYNNFLLCPPFSILLAGQAAVCLFFVLSGYVLSYRFMGADTMKLKIIEAVIKRPIRLAGVILFTMLPMFSFVLTGDFWCRRLWVDYDVYAKMIGNILAGGMFSPSMFYYNPPMWTISIELWGSFLTFGLCFVIGSWPRTLRLIILAAALIYFRHDYYVAFIFGIIIADLHKNWNIDCFIKYRNAVSYGILIPALLLFSYQYNLVPEKQLLSNINHINSGYPMLGAMLLFIFVICNDRIKSILEFKPLVFIGGISYSIYLLHYFMLCRYAHPIYNIIVSALELNIYISFIILLTVMVIFILGFSWMVDRFIDKPCINFSSWFSKKLIIEIQARIASFKIIPAGSQYLRAILATAKKKVHSLFAPAANIPDADISRQPAAPVKVD